MAAATRTPLLSWTTLVPAVAFVALLASWGRSLPPVAVAVVGLLLAAAVLAAVHHAEVVALRVGEPFGSLLLAVAVTVIEVGMIVTLMISGDGSKTGSLARDTVFAAAMITCNGILGLCLLVATVRRHVAVFNAEGTGGALATVATLATLSLVLPSFTTSRTGPEFSPGQLAFAALASLAVYGVFVAVQTGRHRDYFLPMTRHGEVIDEEHAAPPSSRAALASLGLLVLALVAVVGDAKAVSPAIESGVERAGFPPSFVGVVIALLVLLPETLAAVRAARRDRVQTSLNLALGSAIASIGLTIPAIAVASIWLDGPLVLGLGSTQIVLLVLTVVVGVLTVVPGRATLLQAGVHLALFGAFLFLAISP
jgi:Ca2+:H+ antiporter